MVDSHGLADLVADALQHRHRLAQIEVEDPRSEGVPRGVGERTDDRDRLQRCHVQWQQVALVAEQDRRPLRRDPRPDPVLRVGEHLPGVVLIDIRVVEQPHPQLGFEHPPHAGVEILLAGCARLDGIGQVRVCGVGDRHLQVDPDGHGTSGGVGQVGCEAVGHQVANGVGVAHHEALESPRATEHFSEEPSVTGRGDAVQVHVCGHDVAGTRPDRSLERRQVDVPELGVGQVDLVVVPPAESRRRNRRSAWGLR